MIEFKQVSKHYGPQDVLVEVDLRILAGDRLGVVGPNGAGKSTLFELITGTIEPDRGEVLRAADLRAAYLRQVLNPDGHPHTLIDYVAGAVPELQRIEQRLHQLEHRLAEQPDELDRPRVLEELGRLQTAFEAGGGYTLRSRAQAALGELGFDAQALNQPLDSFSGGWQMRAELARVLISDPDLLLLDEPSNYLDVPAVEWLQRYLRGFQGTLVLISHDRYLLNALTVNTLEVNAGRCTLYTGTYREYLVARRERQERLLAQQKNQLQKRKEIERFVERFRSKNTKATQVQSRVKMLAKMKVVETPDAIQTRGRIRIPAPPHCGSEVLRLEKAGLTYDGVRWVLRDVDLSIQRGEKTALVGLNGLGKTTLLRMLAGERALSAGRRVLGHRVQTGYQTQDFAESMPPDATAFDTVRSAAPDTSSQAVRTLLGSFGFSGDAVEKKVAVLSGGEKIRLAFARLLAKPPNFLILDEPTTHLDIHAREALEEALTSYQGTLFFVSHDIEFLRRVATGIIAMTPPGVRRYPGDYDYFKEKSAQETTGLAAATTASSDGGGQTAGKQERIRRLQAATAKKKALQKQLRSAETRVIALESEQQALLQQLERGDQATAFAATSQRLAEVVQELQQQTGLWENAAEGLDGLENATTP